MGITLDNASNNSTFIQSLTTWSISKSLSFDKNFHFRCFAHVINLGVQEALTCLEESISKVKFVIQLFIIFIKFSKIKIYNL